MVLSSLTSGFRCMRYAIRKGTELLGDSGFFPCKSTAEVRRKSPMRDPANTAVICCLSSTPAISTLFLSFLIHYP